MAQQLHISYVLDIYTPVCVASEIALYVQECVKKKAIQ
jgi:hypothetical protein